MNEERGVTPRALIAGLLLAAGVGASVPYLGFQVRGSIASAFFYSQIAHAVLFILVIFINLLLRWCRLGAFNAGELVVMFICMSLGNASGTVLSYWMPLVAGPYYQANAENNWLNVLVPLIPEALMPRDLDAIHALYEGSRSSVVIRWEVWIGR